MYVPQIDLRSAQAALQAAEEKAGAIGMKAAIVVLDRGGEIVASARMDGAWPGAFDLAIGKAQTARAFHAPSAAFVPAVQPAAPLFSVNTVAGGKYVILGGGVPVEIDGQIAGAIGVSGGTAEQDMAVAAVAAGSCHSTIERKKS